MKLMTEKFELQQVIDRLEKQNSSFIKMIEEARHNIYIKKTKVLSNLEKLKDNEKTLIFFTVGNNVGSEISKADTHYHLKLTRAQISENEQLIKNFNEEELNLKREMNGTEFEENKSKISYYQKEIFEIQTIIDKYVSEQTKYYLEMLHRGFDTRNEGLVWIIKRLIELNANIDYLCFPQFITSSNADYLIKLSHMEIELNQYRLILKGLKMRQHKLNKAQREAFSKVSNISNRNYLTKFKTTKEVKLNLDEVRSHQRKATVHNHSVHKDLSHDSDFSLHVNQQIDVMNPKAREKFLKIESENSIKKKRLMELEYQDFNYQNMFFQEENMLISVAVNSLKRKMLTFANDQGVFEVDVTNDIRLAQYFEVNMKSQEFFKEILRIKNLIQGLEVEILKVKKEKLIRLRTKFEVMNKNQNIIKIIEYDLLFSALFGSG